MIIILFIFGLAFGSFSNVIIYRVPKNISIIKPNSFCTNCKREIKWIHKIPIFSWIFLKGKCSYCKSKISYLYPLNEFFVSLIFIVNGLSLGLNENINIENNLISLCIFSLLIYIIAVIDIQNLIIPNRVIVIGFCLAFLNGIIISFLKNDYYYLLNRLFTGILGFLSLEIIIFILFLITSKYAFGSGDSKFYALTGFWLGFNNLIAVFALSIYLGGIFCLFGILLNKLNRKDKIPFAPFISLSAYFVALFGSEKIWNIFSSLYISP